MPPRTLQQVLGETPTGKVIPMSLDDVGKYLRDNYINSDSEKARMDEANRRLALYYDAEDARNQILAEIEGLFKNPRVKQLRKEFVHLGMFQNVTRRIIDEISTVYAEAATRRVRSRNQDYQKVLGMARMDRKMRKANRFANLLNEVFILYRVRRGTRVPCVEVVTPNRFFAVAHPLDPTDLVAVGFKTGVHGRTAQPFDPAWVVWSEAERFLVDQEGRIIQRSYARNEFGRIPGVLHHREEPDASLLNPTPGRDLIAAHKAVALLNVLMLKEQKSGTKVPYTTGDIADTAQGQPMESEVITHFQDGVVPGTLDMGADPRTYIDATRAVIKQVAANYGIPESVFDLSYQATSGFEIELKRVGLREKRRDQIIDFRPTEQELAEVMAQVSTSELEDVHFTADGWNIDFGEIDAPQDPMAKLSYWKTLREMGLANTLDFILEMHPEFKPRDAAELLEQNMEIEIERVQKMRSMQRENAGVDDGPESAIPEENGGEGFRASQPRNGPPPNGALQ